MRPRFQADADFNLKIILGLRRREPVVDFQDAQAGGMIGIPDPEVLQKAAVMDRILVSHDRNTMPAHFSQFIRSRSSPELLTHQKTRLIESRLSQRFGKVTRSSGVAQNLR
jgi:hypothetical protein